MIGTYARYLAGWAIVTAALLVALTRVFPGVAGESGVAAATLGVTLCAAVDLAVFALVLRSLNAGARGFARLWGLSVFLKVLVFGSAIALVAGRKWFPVDGFVRVLIVSFVVYAHHEIFWLMLRGAPRAGKTEAKGAPAC
jgi:hypothetical protein